MEGAATENDGEVAKSPKTTNELLLRACSQYVPALGSVSVLLFSTNVTNPRILRSLFSPYDVIFTNALWLNAHIGAGLYIYTRRHMQSLTQPWRITYSLCGSVLFNFGTVLFWATTKVLLPKCDPLRVLFGVASGVGFLAVARRYLQFVDESV